MQLPTPTRDRYILDIATLTQTNVRTGFSRNVKIISTSSPSTSTSATTSTPGPSYQWLDDSGWKPYSPAICKGITATLAGGSSKHTFTHGSTQYEIDLSALTQTNTRTGFKRRVRFHHPSPSGANADADAIADASPFDLFNITSLLDQQPPPTPFFVVGDLDTATASTNSEAIVEAETDPGKGTRSDEPQCPICLCPYDDDESTVHLRKCGHPYHRDCLVSAFNVKPKCPLCGQNYGAQIGTQPAGSLQVVFDASSSLPGFPPQSGVASLRYELPSGTQGSAHPSPGTPYSGTSRIAFLPLTPEGLEVLALLIHAFVNRQMFTVGTSITTGRANQIVWNGIHAKTSRHSGSYGYPDPTYFSRVLQELSAFGLTPP